MESKSHAQSQNTDSIYEAQRRRYLSLGGSVDSDPSRFRVMSFNILAPSTLLPNLFTKVKPEDMEVNKRFGLILK
jgi:mRNA deadenylase 3'-5' endonuclease subunit Ccr4